MPQLAPARTPNPGRDLPVAVAVGLGMLAAVAAALFIRNDVFAGLVILAVCGAMWELARALSRRDIHLPLVPLLVGTAGILVSAYLTGPEALVVAFLLVVGGAVVWRVLDGNGRAALRDSAAAAFATTYLPFLAGFTMLMLRETDGSARVALFILLGTGVVFYFLPRMMVALGNVSPWLAGAFGALLVLGFFLVFWLRARYQRNRGN